MSTEVQSLSKRPKDRQFFQQTLPACQPMFTAKNSSITFLVIGVIFIPLGIGLLIVDNSVTEYVVDYTDCKPAGSDQTCSELYHPWTLCTCTEYIEVSADIRGPVYLYYALDNFYQNHRRYARSKSDAQLLGNPVSTSQLSNCKPYDTVKNTSNTYAILPCGAIANTIFNDTFTIEYATDTLVPVPMTSEGIAWRSDVERKYGTLSKEALVDTVKPPNWMKSITERSPAPFKTDEELIVWMRIAALPNFRKLHRRIVHQGTFKDGLPAGTYVVTINNAFPVSQFGGRKSLILGNVSWLGGKNRTLGILALVTGSLHLVLGILFLIFSRNRNTPHFIHDMMTRDKRTMIAETIDGIRGIFQ